MRFKCTPDWLERYLERRIKRNIERDERLRDWHDYFIIYGSIDGTCLLFETVERKLSTVGGEFIFQDRDYYEYRLKET